MKLATAPNQDLAVGVLFVLVMLLSFLSLDARMRALNAKVHAVATTSDHVQREVGRLNGSARRQQSLLREAMR